jgi:hypothetical protein
MVLPSFFPRVEPPLYQNQPLCNLMYGIHTYPCNSLTIEVLNKLHWWTECTSQYLYL